MGEFFSDKFIVFYVIFKNHNGKMGSKHREIASQIQKGFLANLPIAASVGAYGSVLGVLAAQKNISWLELLIMNLTIFADRSIFKSALSRLIYASKSSDYALCR